MPEDILSDAIPDKKPGGGPARHNTMDEHHSELQEQNFYQYQPLETPHSIRMVELLPGAPEEAIQVVLHYRSLAQMSICVAVSHEWGGTSRQHEIFCEGSVL